MKFSEVMWDGFVAVCQKTEIGLQTCRDLSNFFKKLATLEETYAKGVKELCQGASGSVPSNAGAFSFVNQVFAAKPVFPEQEIGSIKICWDFIQVESIKLSDKHLELANNINNDIVQAMNFFIKTEEPKRKNSVTVGQKLSKDLSDSYTTLARTKDTYDKACRELDVAKQMYNRSLQEANFKSQNVEKFNLKIKQAEERIQQTDAEYQSALKKANELQEKFYKESMPTILDELYDFEKQRLEMLKRSFDVFTKLKNELPEQIRQFAAEVEKTIAVADIEKDLDTFIEKNRPSISGPPQAIPYLPVIKYPFGCTLEQLMEKEQKDLGTNIKVPRMVTQMLLAVDRLNGKTTEGLFRIGAKTTDIQDLREQVENGDYKCAAVTSPHVPAALLKQWLRELKSPIVPFNLYDECIKIVEDKNEITRATTLFSVINRIPSINKAILLEISKFLRDYSQEEVVKVTKMNLDNLSMVFAPNILRNPNPSPELALKNTGVEIRFMAEILKNLQDLPFEV